MRPIRLPPSKIDIAIAEAVEREATPARERPMKVATWLADEHVLCAISGLLWLYSKRGSAAQRAQADHLLLSVVVTTVLPHLAKRLVNRERPDRSIGKRCAGVPKSGKPDDAFPSGHAMHIGAVASAISWMYPKAAVPAWTAGLALACTRIVLLAHWTSDVVVGLVAGALVERALRPFAFRKPSVGRYVNRALSQLRRLPRWRISVLERDPSLRRRKGQRAVITHDLISKPTNSQSIKA